MQNVKKYEWVEKLIQFRALSKPVLSTRITLARETKGQKREVTILWPCWFRRIVALHFSLREYVLLSSRQFENLRRFPESKECEVTLLTDFSKRTDQRKQTKPVDWLERGEVMSAASHVTNSSAATFPILFFASHYRMEYKKCGDMLTYFAPRYTSNIVNMCKYAAPSVPRYVRVSRYSVNSPVLRIQRMGKPRVLGPVGNWTSKIDFLWFFFRRHRYSLQHYLAANS